MHINLDQAEAFLSGTLLPLATLVGRYIWYRRKQQEDRKRKDPIVERVKKSALIESKLDYILRANNADRVWVVLFHNGGTYYPTGKSIHKFSMVYENTLTEVESISERFQNIPTSLFSKFITEVYDNNYLEVKDNENKSPEQANVHFFTEETGIKSFYGFAIKSIDNKFLGIFGVDFIKEKTALTVENMTKLQVDVTSIGGEIYNYLKDLD